MERPSFLPNLSVTRPITILVSLMAILVVGGLAYVQIPLELVPEGFTRPFLGVWVPYQNANPREVEEQIARPVEEQVRTISGVTSVQSYSQNSGCWIWLEFSGKTDMEVAYDQLRDRMERARAMLPDDIDRYFLRKFGKSNVPIGFLSIAFPDDIEDPYHIVDYVVKRPLERLDGVATVEIWGAQEKSIQIMIDQDKVKAHGVDMYAVIQEMEQENFAISSGWVYEGDKKFIVRSLARFENLEDIRNLPINQFGLTVGDIAEVKYDIQKQNWTQRINGGKGALIEISKESIANSVELSQQLKEIINTQISKHPALANADVEILFVEGDIILGSIDTLKDTAFWGGIFAIFILLFFLRNIRMTMIMMFAIPLSILISLILVYFIGWSLNSVVMMGIMISIGMVVDNGIVVLENIYHKRSEGMGLKKASIRGASEVNLAIIMATLTTVAVFLPFLFMNDGGSGFNYYMQRIGLPVVFALLGSLFVALVLIPLATSRLGGDKFNEENKLISYTKKHYNRMLEGVLNRRVEAFIGMMLIMVLTVTACNNVKKADDQDGNIGDITLMFDLPSNFTKAEATEYFKSVEDTVVANSDRYRLRAYDTGFRQNFGRIRIYLEKTENKQWYDVIYNGITTALNLNDNIEMSRDEILADLKERVPKKPGVEVRTSWMGNSSGQEGTVSIYLYGDDTGRLEVLAEEVKRRMRQMDGVISVETDDETGNDEIKVTIDREVASRNGIRPNEVANALMYAVRGLNLPRFQAEDKEIEMRVQLKEEDRENLVQLKNMTFPNQQGQAIPLSAIASFSVEKGFGQIARQDGKTFLEVKAFTSNDDLEKTSSQIDALMADFPMPYGYSWSKGRRFRDFSDQQAAFFQAIFLALVFVYLIMAILFESFLLPLSIMFTIPLSFFGAFLTLLITGTPQDIMAGIGMVILVGVVVNNGIVLVDMINRRRKEGFSRYDAILDAGKNRFRPIMMTSFTTISGLIPMALGSGDLIGIPYAPMGRAIIGGMLASTVLTLLVVPVFYTIFDDFAMFLRRMLNWLPSKSAPTAGKVSPAAGE